MTTPFHHFKNPYRSIGVGKPDSCSFGEFYGWLGSGIKDKNRVEIYEGDRVSVLEHEYPFTVMFVDSAFWLVNNRMKCYLTYFRNSELEVVGHIAEDES